MPRASTSVVINTLDDALRNSRIINSRSDIDISPCKQDTVKFRDVSSSDSLSTCASHTTMTKVSVGKKKRGETTKDHQLGKRLAHTLPTHANAKCAQKERQAAQCSKVEQSRAEAEKNPDRSRTHLPSCVAEDN
jgi:hypothetical protein